MKTKLIILCLCLSLLFVGCSLPETPEAAADGTPWGEDWTNVGAVMGVEPMADWESQRSEDLLADTGMYFASWIWGEPQRTVEGEASYQAQIFLVLSGCETTEEAEKLASQWRGIADESYLTEEAYELALDLGTFTVIPYRFQGEDASFDEGISATAVIGTYAIDVEITTVEGTGLDLAQTLTEFLNNCHFA